MFNFPNISKVAVTLGSLKRPNAIQFLRIPGTLRIAESGQTGTRRRPSAMNSRTRRRRDVDMMRAEFTY